MKLFWIMTAALVAGLWSGALAQTQHEHQPAGAPPAQASQPNSPAASPAPPSAAMPGHGQMPMGQMMQGMPEQCRAMMQNMPQDCMSMMHRMMQGHMGMTPGNMQAQPANQSPATKAYIEAAERMHGPMMAGILASDPDVAFVRGMIAHHQGAIDMARVSLQYGKNDQAKKWASDVIREQQREINEMEEWLKKNAR